MDGFIKFPIIKNKANKQINLNPRKRDIPKEIRGKFDSYKYLKIRWEDIDFE